MIIFFVLSIISPAHGYFFVVTILFLVIKTDKGFDELTEMSLFAPLVVQIRSFSQKIIFNKQDPKKVWKNNMQVPKIDI